MPTTLLMLPPQSDKTRAGSKGLQEAVPSLTVVVAETDADAARAIGNADAAFGTMPDALLARAGRLRWLQAPQAAPPAGYYTPALIAHPAVVTNFREIYNDTRSEEHTSELQSRENLVCRLLLEKKKKKKKRKKKNNIRKTNKRKT